MTGPSVLLIAHGTRSEAGFRTAHALADAVRIARPGLTVELCFLDVRAPDLPTALAALPGPAVAVPVLLSTGYHVRSDIPAAVAGRPDVQVTLHLGPDVALARAGADRLRAARSGRPPATSVALVATGSSEPAAAADLAGAADLLAAELGRPVHPLTLIGDLAARLDALGDVDVVPYLLAEGLFADQVRAAAGTRTVAGVIGTHPALVELVLARYDGLATAADGAGERVR